MDGYRVRPAHPLDRDLIVGFNRALARETEGIDLDEATIEAGVAALLSDPAKGRYFIAEFHGGGGRPAEERAGKQEAADDVAIGGAIEAAGQLMLTLEWSDWRNGFIWWIQSVYVAPPHRRRGVYRILHEHVREAGRASGAVGLRLYVDRENEVAQAAYVALGMDESRYVMYEEIWR